MSNIVRLAKEFVIKYRGSVIARCRDFSLSINKNTVDITSFDTASWEEYVGDLKTWSISFSSMLTRTSTATTWSNTGANAAPTGTFDGLYMFMVGTSEEGDYGATVALGDFDNKATAVFEGIGILTSLSADGAVGDVISYSGEIQGAGALTRKTT